MIISFKRNELFDLEYIALKLMTLLAELQY